MRVGHNIVLHYNACLREFVYQRKQKKKKNYDLSNDTFLIYVTYLLQVVGLFITDRRFLYFLFKYRHELARADVLKRGEPSDHSTFAS